MMKRIAIVHPTRGVFVGLVDNYVIFSLTEFSGQASAATFPDEAAAVKFVSKFEMENDPTGYRFYEVETRGDYADVLTLLHAGVPEKMIEPMIEAEMTRSRIARLTGTRFQ